MKATLKDVQQFAASVGGSWIIQSTVPSRLWPRYYIFLFISV